MSGPSLSSNAPVRTEGPGGSASIGPSISIKGDLSGDENLIIHGTLEGSIHLEQHNVTVGKSGRVKADVYGKSIHVEGEVRGNLYGTDEIVLRASGRVHGNIVAPRVTLENGSKFKGAIDMDAGDSTAAKTPPAAKPAPAATAGQTGSTSGQSGPGSQSGSPDSTASSKPEPAKAAVGGSGTGSTGSTASTASTVGS